MAFFYNIFAYLIYPGIKIAGSFNSKARRLAKGLKDNTPRIEKLMHIYPSDGRYTMWVHCASLGEFEQGRPVIEAMKSAYPDMRIILTFFSPSGYEVRKDYPLADYVFYLSPDTPSNARRFVAAVRPDIAVFIKYEYWFNYLSELKEQGIPSYMVSAIFRSDMHFFKFYGGFFRRMLRLVSRFFVQDETSARLLRTIGIENNVTTCGDTRFDRVETVKNNAPDLPLVEKFVAGPDPVIVCGSTWPADEQMLLLLMKAHPGVKFIIVPHEIDPVSVANLIIESGRSAIRYKEAQTNADFSGATLMVVDIIGILSGVYRYGHIAYVGGGFGAGIHNILEAAVWGKPVIFGPRFAKFNEAVGLVAAGGAFPIGDYDGLNNIFTSLLANPEKLKASSEIASDYVHSNIGATEVIIGQLFDSQSG